jgi:hypothetical protein
MPSSKYHRQQAELLAGLALSTNNATEADRFNLAALEHLERAEVSEGTDRPSDTPGPATDEQLDPN